FNESTTHWLGSQDAWHSNRSLARDDGSLLSLRTLFQFSPWNHRARVGGSLPHQRPDCLREPGTTRSRRCLRAGESTGGGEARDLGGQPVAGKTVSLRRWTRLLFGRRLRLFRDCLLRAGSSRLAPVAAEFERADSFRRPRSGEMDYGLCAQRSCL